MSRDAHFLPQPRFFGVLEGPDGVGKTTVCNVLKERHPTWVIAPELDEGYPVGQAIRRMLKGDIRPVAGEMGLLFAAQRIRKMRLLMDQIISRGSLESAVIILDRWFPSTVVYQDYWGLDELAELCKGLPTPDAITYLRPVPLPFARDRALSHQPSTSYEEIVLKYDRLFARFSIPPADMDYWPTSADKIWDTYTKLRPGHICQLSCVHVTPEMPPDLVADCVEKVMGESSPANRAGAGLR